METRSRVFDGAHEMDEQDAVLLLIAKDKRIAELEVDLGTAAVMHAEQIDALEITNQSLVGLILRMVDRWWPFVHGSVMPSETAKNLLKEATDALELNRKHLKEKCE